MNRMFQLMNPGQVPECDDVCHREIGADEIGTGPKF